MRLKIVTKTVTKNGTNFGSSLQKTTHKLMNIKAKKLAEDGSGIRFPYALHCKFFAKKVIRLFTKSSPFSLIQHTGYYRNIPINHPTFNLRHYKSLNHFYVLIDFLIFTSVFESVNKRSNG